jgi:hypothetical protein
VLSLSARTQPAYCVYAVILNGMARNSIVGIRLDLRDSDCTSVDDRASLLDKPVHVTGKSAAFTKSSVRMILTGR